MTELISRQAALAEIDKNRDALLSSGMTGAEHILVHYGRRVIEELPTIEPKHGKWEDVEEILYEGNTEGTPYTVTAVGYKCSECGTEMGTLWSFCPNCGAKMDEVSDERTY